MSFASPLMLFGLLAAAVPIVIHLIHKRRPREQRFAAIELLLRSVERVERRWRLRRFLLLAARVTLLAALALAAAGPMLGEEAALVASRAGPERLAIVVDASLSMRARVDGRTAFARAVQAARGLVDAMGPEDQAVIVVAAAKPALPLARPTGARPELLRALDALEPGYDHADLAEAVTAGARALGALADVPGEAPGSGPRLRVVLLSDLAQHGLRAAADLSVPGRGARAALEVVDVLADAAAALRENAGITALEVEDVPGDAPHTVEARARVQSFARERAGAAAARDVTLRQGDRELARGSLDVVPGTIVDKALRHAFEAPGLAPLELALEPDALAEDDVRYAAVEVRRQVRALVVDGAPSGVPKEDEIYYLERALAAGAPDQPAPRVVTGDDLSRVDLGAFDVVFLAGVPAFAREDGARLREFVERGGGLFISVAEGMDLELYDAELGPVLPRPFRLMRFTDPERGGVGASGVVGFAEPALDHPVMTIFEGEALGGLLSARTSAYAMLDPDARRPMTTLLEYDDGQPALVEALAGRGRVMVLTTSIDRDLTDLPIRPAFLPLVRQVLLHLGGALSRPDPRRTLVGEARDLAVPQGARALRVRGPGGEETTWEGPELASGVVRFPGSPRPGHHAVEVSLGAGFEAAPGEAFAVNVDPRESDLRPVPVDEATALLEGEGGGGASGASTALARARALGGDLSPETLASLLLLLMLLAYLAESALTARRAGQ